MNEFFDAYIEAALWSTSDESTPSGGEPLDKNYSKSDIAIGTLEQMKVDCDAFEEAHQELIAGNLKRAGHDFWLNRNGHGSGFWDGDWEEPAATILDNASKTFGEFNLYVSDGVIYSD